MKLSLKDHRTETLLRQRVALLGAGAVLLGANLLLVMLLATREERWILIPQFDISRQLALTSDSFSEEYLSTWASSLCEDLLTTNPQTVEVKGERFLQIAARPTGEIKDLMGAMVSSIKRDGAHTVFYPKSTQVIHQDKTVSVRGTFLTYLGRDHRPVVTERTFLLTWHRGPHGVLLVQDLQEVREKTRKKTRKQKP